MKTFCGIGSALVILLLCTFQSNAQGIPKKVKQAFTDMFPNALQVQWDRDDDESYEADFVSNSQEMSALFDAAGGWKEKEITISKDKLPNAVKQTLVKDFNDALIKDIARIVTADHIFYEIEIDEGEKEERHAQNDDDDEKYCIELIFNQNGELVKRETDNG